MDERKGLGPAAVRSQADEARLTPPPPARIPRVSAPDDKTSTLSSHLGFEGTMRFSGKVIIDCDFRGSVVTEDTLVVGPSGKLEAEVTAGVVEVAGKLRGNIKAKTRVKIFSGGEVQGNIETPTVSMEDGVVFEGNCTRPQDGQSLKTSPALKRAPSGILSDPQPIV